MFAFIIPIGVSYILKPPISNESISISPPGSLDCKFHINSGNTYNLEFNFRGDGYTDPVSTNGGVPIPVYLEIYSLTNEKYIFQGELITKGSFGSSQGYAMRNIKSIWLKPGNYKLSMYIVKDVPEFTNFKTHIAMKLSQITYENYYFASIFIPFLLIITDIIFVIFFIIRSVKLKKLIE